MSVSELDQKAEAVVAQIAGADPNARHTHLDQLHRVISDYALTGKGIPARLRQLQEDLTNEAIEARFDNMPV
ncbi:MAG: hypothetical protein ACRBBU_08270 [Pseudooceanicola sp.]